MDKNRELALKLGLCWHEWERSGTRPEYICKCCLELCDYPECMTEGIDFITPDGVHLLLREMRNRKDWPKFLDFISVKYCSPHYATIEEAFELIIEPGKLRDAANDFLSPLKGKEAKPYSAPSTRWNKEIQSGE